MAELDKIPQKQAVEIETVKLEDSVLQNVTEVNNQIANIVSRFGEIYIRRNELQADLKRLDELQVQFDDELVERIKEWGPDVLVIGNDYEYHQIIGVEYVPKIEFFNKIPGFSTTNILKNQK